MRCIITTSREPNSLSSCARPASDTNEACMVSCVRWEPEIGACAECEVGCTGVEVVAVRLRVGGFEGEG